jgi:Ni/Fe-hydrogenase subunit HybB-like protein
VVLLGFKKVRTSQTGLVAGAFLAVLGFVMNRLNVSVTGMERAAGVRYVPSVMEVVVSVAFIGLAMAVFALAVHYLAIFPEKVGARQREKKAKADWPGMVPVGEGE